MIFCIKNIDQNQTKEEKDIDIYVTPCVKADTWINVHEKCDKNSRPLCNTQYLFLFFHGLLVRIFQHSYLTTSEYTQIQTDLHIQTNKEKRGSCNPQYVLISIADIKSLQNFHFLKNIWTMKRYKYWLVNVIWCILLRKITFDYWYSFVT